MVCNSGIKGFQLPYAITKEKQILKRFPIALTVSGFAPFLFEKGFDLLNTASLKIVQASKGFLAQDSIPSGLSNIGYLDCIAMLGFDVVLLVTLLPLVFKTFVRWFDLLCLGALTPMAMTCYIFDQHKDYHRKWWNAIKKSAYVQLIYVVFVTIMGYLVMGIHDGDLSWQGMFVKIGVIIGGLWRLANPPDFAKPTLDYRQDALDVYRQTRDHMNIKRHLAESSKSLGKGFDQESRLYIKYSNKVKGSKYYKKVSESESAQKAKSIVGKIKGKVLGKFKKKDKGE